MMSGKQAASGAGKHSKPHPDKRPSSSKGPSQNGPAPAPAPAAAAAAAAADPFSMMLAAAERKATHFRSLRAQIRSTHGSHQQQQQQQPPPDGQGGGGAEGSASSAPNNSTNTLPRIRTESSWSRFFGDISDVEELQAAPITLLATSIPPSPHRTHTVAAASHGSSPSNANKGKAPIRPLASLLASTASAQSAMVSSMPPEVKAQHFGPNYLPEEDSLRNDFAQRYVDSGAGELPGNAVRNPFVRSRFDEYPKLKRLVQIKENLVSARAHAPTYLYADLRASLVPASQHHHDQRRQQQQQQQQQRSEIMIRPTPSSSSLPARSKDQTVDSGTSSTTAEANLPPAVQPSDTDSASSSSPALPVPHPFHLSQLMPIKYDVVIIDPPLEIYDWEGLPSLKSGRAGLDEVSLGPVSMLPGTQSPAPPDPKQSWTWEHIAKLPIPQLTAKESFIFLWVGSGAGDGLERGRELISKWGYRRCEDIVWVRTNKGAAEARLSGEVDQLRELEQSSTTSVLQRSVQHCLMGIRGTIKRSTDSRFVHCNVDTDVLIWEGEEPSSTSSDKAGATAPRARDQVRAKPQEMYSLIENFCLGTRRLELFGTNRNLRRGWLTIGLEVGPHAPGFPDSLPTTYLSAKDAQPREEHERPPPQNSENRAGAFRAGAAAAIPTTVEPVAYVKQQYDSNFGVDRPGCDLRERKNLLPFSADSEALRPKSPPPRNAHSKADSGNPLTPPPANPLALYGQNHNIHNGSSAAASPGQQQQQGGGGAVAVSQWTSPNASYGGHKSSGGGAVLSPGGAMGSPPSSSPRASMHGRGGPMHQHHHHHHHIMHAAAAGPMSPSHFMSGGALPPISGYGVGGGGGSPGPSGQTGLGPGSPTRLRHDNTLQQAQGQQQQQQQQQQQPGTGAAGGGGYHPGGAGLSGLGAGGPKTVSVPSGSETLSGPQASVLFGTKHAKSSGPMGLGRNSRR